MSKAEIWKPVPGYEGSYSVSSVGRLRNERTGRHLAGYVGDNGYRMACLCVGGNVDRELFHSIVARTFIGPRPAGMHVDHIDGNRDHNAAANLRYLSPGDNVRATVARGNSPKGSRNGQAKLNEEAVSEIRHAVLTRGRYYGCKELAARFGVDRSQIQRAAKGLSFSNAIRALSTQPRGGE